MYKSKLQELCQKNAWALPDYSTVKDGPGHNLRFKATVNVNGVSFETSDLFKHLKEAQNEAARLAYTHFSESNPPDSPFDAFGVSNTASKIPAVQHQQPNTQGTFHTLCDDRIPTIQDASGESNTASKIPAVQHQQQPNTQGTFQTLRDDRIPTIQQQQPNTRGRFQTLRDDRIPTIQQPQQPNTRGRFQTLRDDRIPAIQQPQQPNTQGRFQTLRDDRIPMIQHPQQPDAQGTFQTLCYNGISVIHQQQLPNGQQTSQTLHNDRIVSGVKTNKGHKDTQLYKNQLQNYAQKRNLLLPAYSCESEGPPHASRFKSKVVIAGQTYESPDFFGTVKEAEHAAARVALQSLSPHGIEEDNVFYKNLLQELAQKAGFQLPTYNTTGCGASHMPTFVSNVEIEGETFQGEVAKTKKQAEMNAAKVAYLSLKERPTNQSTKLQSPSCPKQEELSTSSQSVITSGLQVNVKPKAPDICTTKASSELFSGDEAATVINPAGKGVLGDYDTICSSKQDMNLSRKRDSSSFDPIFAHSKDPSPSVLSLPLCDPSLSSIPFDCSSNVGLFPNMEKGVGSNSSCFSKVRIYPRTPNMQLPDGVTVCSDEKWLAIKSTPNQVGN